MGHQKRKCDFMAKARPEREAVESLILDNRRRKAHEIAEAVGLIETMGYDKAVNYVKQVRRSMRKSGALPEPENKYAPDEERLADIETLFDLRQGIMSREAAYHMLLLFCYYRLRSQDDNVHIMAFDDTDEKNSRLENPMEPYNLLRLKEKAVVLYMNSKDEEKNAAARAKGFPGAGLNYTSDALRLNLEITEEELQHMKSIKRG